MVACISKTYFKTVQLITYAEMRLSRDDTVAFSLAIGCSLPTFVSDKKLPKAKENSIEIRNQATSI